MTRHITTRLAASTAFLVLLLTVADVVAAPASDAGTHRSSRSHGQRRSNPHPAKKKRKTDTAAVLKGSAAEIFGTEDGWAEDEIRGGAPAVPANYRARRLDDICPDGWKNRPTTEYAVPSLLGIQCHLARELCTKAGKPDGIAVIERIGLPGVAHPREGEWDLGDYRCIDPHHSPLPILPQSELRRLPLPPGRAYVQPSGRPILVNVPTNVYVDAPTVSLTATVLGRRIEVEATAAAFTWTFGDGDTLTTSDRGAPYPAMSTTHTYTTTGTLTITLTTIYTARFRPVGTTTWIPAQGTARVSSPPIPVEVIETRAVLVP